MFVEAIEKVAGFTRPIHIISRAYGSEKVQAGAATLFFVNPSGWALTCRHVAYYLAMADAVNRRYAEYKREVEDLSKTRSLEEARRRMGEKYGFDKTTTVEIGYRPINCVDGVPLLRAVVHPELDVALIHFENYSRLLCGSFPTFASSTADLKPGKMLCRLGYPFPEFSNFAYDPNLDRICWTDSGRSSTPRFPIEGMVTRGLLDGQERRSRFEMSTPGIRGQSGGPAFDTKGVIWGMQSATYALDLDFDVDREVIRQGEPKRVQDYAFLQAGQCVHLDVLKTFMRENKVDFTEAA